MAVDNFHDDYLVRQEDWQSVRDCIEGQRVIKARKSVYLPIPPGMAQSPNDLLASGKRTTNDRYTFYLSFADFPELIAPALTGFQGIIHTNVPDVGLPDKLKYLIEDATPEGEPLSVLWERVTREILITGRIGLLGDVSVADDKVRLASYSAESIINWRLSPLRQGGDPEYVVLREFRAEADPEDDFKNKEFVIYRELRMREDKYQVQVWKADSERAPILSISGTAKAANETNSTAPTVETQWSVPSLFGKFFPMVPLTVINVEDIGYTYGPSPMLALVRRALAIYRKTADYNRAIYIKGDPQIVISGITPNEAPTKIGGEAIWTLPNPQAKAAYLDIDGDGIPIMRTAINDEYDRFHDEGGRLLNKADHAAESGEALRQRQSSNQLSLRSIALSAGMSLQFVLRKIAFMQGIDPSTVKFVADLDFAEAEMQGRELLDLMVAKSQGAPLSQRSIHDRSRRGGLTQLTFEQEVAQLKTEDAGVSGLPEVPITNADKGGESE